MGNCPNESENWQLIAKNQRFSILRDFSGQEVMAYHIFFDDSISLIESQNRAKKRIELGNEESHRHLVKLIESHSEDVGGLCSQFSMQRFYVQRIVVLLEDVRDLQFQMGLQILTQVLKGLISLVDLYDCYFQFNGNMGGFNQKQTVKVWHHPNFSSQRPLLQYSRQPEYQQLMVTQCLKLLLSMVCRQSLAIQLSETLNSMRRPLKLEEALQKFVNLRNLKSFVL